jgi:hypothetical protein
MYVVCIVFENFVKICRISPAFGEMGVALIVVAGGLFAALITIAIGVDIFRTGRAPDDIVDIMNSDRFILVFSFLHFGSLLAVFSLLPPFALCAVLGQNTPKVLIAATSAALPLWLISVRIEPLIQKWRFTNPSER